MIEHHSEFVRGGGGPSLLSVWCLLHADSLFILLPFELNFKLIFRTSKNIESSFFLKERKQFGFSFILFFFFSERKKTVLLGSL